MRTERFHQQTQHRQELNGLYDELNRQKHIIRKLESVSVLEAIENRAVRDHMGNKEREMEQRAYAQRAQDRAEMQIQQQNQQIHHRQELFKLHGELIRQKQVVPELASASAQGARETRSVQNQMVNNECQLIERFGELRARDRANAQANQFQQNNQHHQEIARLHDELNRQKEVIGQLESASTQETKEIRVKLEQMIKNERDLMSNGRG